MPLEPWPPLVPPSNDERAECLKIEGMPCRYVYTHIPLPNAQWFKLDAYAHNSKDERDCIPNLLTDEGTSTDLFTTCCVEIELTWILQISAAFGGNMKEQMSINWNEWNVWVY
jgi:hypothetical protein